MIENVEREAVVAWLEAKAFSALARRRPNIEQAAHDGGYALALLHASKEIADGAHLPQDEK